jgi:hypothetical protein
MKFIPIQRGVTIQTPPVLFIMLKNDVGMLGLEFPALVIGNSFFMAGRAGKIIRRQGRRKRPNTFLYRRRSCGGFQAVPTDHYAACKKQKKQASNR